MKQSEMFGSTLKEVAVEEQSKNAVLLLRGGYIYKQMSGVYSFMPLGWRVIQKIMNILREEMNRLPRTQEVLMSSMQPLDLWRESGRLEDISEIMYTLEGEDTGLGPTHEEIISDIFRHNIHSYKNLPVGLYQIQTKYRRELRAKSGLLRGREFLMKDLYSFHATEEDLHAYYAKAQKAYDKVYARCGIQALLTEAPGGVFSKFSHEYQTPCAAGEDVIYIHKDGELARNKELVASEQDADILDFCGGKINKVDAVEVGNIFPLNKKFSIPMNILVDDEKGEKVPVWMGCFGIGVSRLMGVVAEVVGTLNEKEAKLVWPEELAPYAVHVLDLTPELAGKSYYEKLVKEGKEVLYDDRDLSAGTKFADADLVGAPTRIIVSKKSMAAGGVEVINMVTGESTIEKM